MGHADNPFSRTNSEELDALAQRHGFKRRGQQNWVRRTSDFLQLINLQRSQWADEERYLNFALWLLAYGEPPTLAESKFHYRTRAEDMGATDLTSFFAVADSLRTLAALWEAEESGRIAGLTTKELRDLLT